MDNQEEIVKDLVEVTFPEKDDFLKIRETLSRIGVASRREQELFKLDGKPTNIDESDIGRRNTIVGLLAQWNLVSVVNEQQIADPKAPLSQIKIIPFKEKSEWKLTTKYSIGSNNS